MSRPMLTETERAELAVMLQAYYPGRVPDVTAGAWIVSLVDRRADDVALGIKAMAETSEFPTLKALKDAVEGAASARAARAREQDEARLLAASTERPVDRVKTSRILGCLVAAMRAKATKAEIEALVERERSR